jgi:hypothetical protein
MANKPRTERYVSVKSLVFETPAFRTLPSAALKLWFDLRTQFRGANNGNITAALSALRQRGWRSSDTLNKALWELLGRGLLRRTREGKPGPLRICALYAFTDLPTSRDDRREIANRGPSMEFVTWVQGSSFAPESRAKKLARNPSRKKSPLRNSERQHFDNRSVTATKNGELEQRAATKTEAVGAGSDCRNAAPVLASEPIVH